MGAVFKDTARSYSHGDEQSHGERRTENGGPAKQPDLHGSDYGGFYCRYSTKWVTWGARLGGFHAHEMLCCMSCSFLERKMSDI